jgi:hypothetical protein
MAEMVTLVLSSDRIVAETKCTSGGREDLHDLRLGNRVSWPADQVCQ